MRTLCHVKSKIVNVAEASPTLCGDRIFRKCKLPPLTAIINRHSSHSALVHDAAVLVIFTQFITACHSLHLFPGDTSWQWKKFLVQSKMIKLHNDSVELTVADKEGTKIDLTRYVQ